MNQNKQTIKEELVCGKNPVYELIKSGKQITKAFIINNKEFIDLLKLNRIPYEIVNKDYLNKLTTANHQGIVVYTSEYVYNTIEDIISEDEHSLIIALDGLEDPHNLGAIIRTAEISAADGIIIPKNRSVRVTPTVVKVSTGAIEHVKIAQITNMVMTLKRLKKEGYWIVGAEATEKSTNFWKTNLDMKICLVIGSEGNGISRLVLEECDLIIKIPMWGEINSLNASVSAGILIYEIRRQQNKN